MLLNYTLLDFKPGVVLNDAEAIHSVVAALFGNSNGARPLWRVDTMRNGKPQVLLQWIGAVAPAWDVLFKMEDGCLTRESFKIKQVEIAPTEGHQFRFRLHGNNQKAIKLPIAEDVVQRKRVSQAPEIWLEKKAEHAGFQIVSLQNIERDAPISVHKRKIPFFLSNCIFEGVLQVTDKEKFENAIAFGVGRGKAFGMGLLSIARA